MSNIGTSTLSSLDEAVREALTRLLPQVSNSAPPLTAKRMEEVLACPSTHIATATLDDEIVGMALLCVHQL